MSESVVVDIAKWVVDAGYPVDFNLGDVPPPEPLRQAIIDYVLEDRTGIFHGNELDREAVELWLADEAGWPNPSTKGQANE